MKPPPAKLSSMSHLGIHDHRDHDVMKSNDSGLRRPLQQAFLSPYTARSPRSGGSGHQRHGTRSGSSSSHIGSAGRPHETLVRRRGSSEHQGHQGNHMSRGRDHKEYREVTDFDVREDLRSWQVEISPRPQGDTTT